MLIILRLRLLCSTKPQRRHIQFSKCAHWVSGCQGLSPHAEIIGMGDDTVGNPQGDQMFKFLFFEGILLLKFDKRLPVVRFEATLSQSTVPSPPLLKTRALLYSRAVRCPCTDRRVRAG